MGAETDLPPDWNSADTFRCGISWPSDDPWTNMSSCCAGPVHVSNGCLQWCETELAAGSFIDCAVGTMPNWSYGGAFCNGNAAVGWDGGLVGSVALLWVLVKVVL